MANKLSSRNAEQEKGFEMLDRSGQDFVIPAERVITRADNQPPSLVALFADQLAETYKLEFGKVDPIRAKANAREQKIETDEHLAAWTVIYNEAKALFDELDTARKNEKRPMVDTVDGAFKSSTDPLVTIMTWIKNKADAFNRDKVQKQRAAEAAERERLAKIERDALQRAKDAAEFEAPDVLDQVAEAYQAREQREAIERAPTADVTRVSADGGGSARAAAVWKFTVEDPNKVDLNALRLVIPWKEVEKAIAKVVKQQQGATTIAGVKVYEDVGTTFRK